MDFLIAGLLVIDLAVTLAGIQFLRRGMAGMEKTRREDAAAMLAENARTTEALQGVWDRLEPLEKVGSGVDILLARDVASDIVKQMEQRMKDSPVVLSAQEEARLSKSMEEGISSILSYTAGKVPGVELRL